MIIKMNVTKKLRKNVRIQYGNMTFILRKRKIVQVYARKEDESGTILVYFVNVRFPSLAWFLDLEFQTELKPEYFD